MKCQCGCGQDTPLATKTRTELGEKKGDPRPYVPGHRPVGENSKVAKVAELLQNAGIDPEDVAKIDKINLYQGYYKDPEGNSQKVDMASIQVTPTWADGPQWPVVQPAIPAVVKYADKRKIKHVGRTTVLLPDPQIGFWRLADGDLIPTHDRLAMNASLAMIDILRPHRIVNLGDFLDLSEWSQKFAIFPEFANTTQLAVNEGHTYLAEQKSAAGSSLEEHDLLEGNHDDRIPRLIVQNAKAALRLHRADEPKGWPVLSVPNLLALDSLGVNYHSGYPAARLKLADRHGRQASLWALHGEKLDMQRQARASRISTIQGHSHHLSMHSETYTDDDGDPIDVRAYSIGSLCRNDGVVPSTRGAPDLYGNPVRRHESWTQAIGILHETDDMWALEIVDIVDGKAYFRDQIIDPR